MTSSPRIAHLISEYSGHEAMGRTIAETASRIDGQHHLITTSCHDSGDTFASVHELGGRLVTFPAATRTELDRALDAISPDVVHLHTGVLGSFVANRAGLGRSDVVRSGRSWRTVMTMYAWPNLPGRAAWKHAGWTGLRSSNVLPPRVLATAVLPEVVVRRSLAALGPRAILTPDPRVLERLGDLPGIPVTRLPSGAPVDPRRASFDPADGRPTVVFAGRAESVRGIGTLLEAFPRVLARVPSARLRLLVLPRPELSTLLDRAAALGLGDALDVRTDAVPDLLAELAKAQVGSWPFLADYTTSPPAMALAEGMSVGLPVVGTSVACIRAVMEPGVDGLAVAPGDAPALADALTRLLTDRELWTRYSRAAVDAASRLTWDAAADATRAAYIA